MQAPSFFTSSAIWTLSVITLLVPIYRSRADLAPIHHNNPGLVVDLGVGLWALPLPMDYDGDGDWDMVVATVNKASPGLYFFENRDGNVPYPIFQPAKRIGDAKGNLTVSHDGGSPIVCSPGEVYPEFRQSALENPQKIPYQPSFHADRDKQWKMCDVDGDGLLDLVVGASDWRDYGWDDAFDEEGRWTRGPIHGRVYWMRNQGTNEAPAYAAAREFLADGQSIDVFGAPSPCFADWDGDGDKDLICGSFLDAITYFENVGTAAAPTFNTGRPALRVGPTPERLTPLVMELQMLQVISCDWDKDGQVDLVIGQEDGRVALARNSGRFVHRVPVFESPKFFQQKADLVKCGALTTPVSVDWDGDRDEDLVCGNTAGFIEFIENMGGNPPRWAAPKRIEAGGEVIHIQAGPNGSIQGPAEAKWGYTVLDVADWDHDGKIDLVVNSIWGKVLWYRNVAEHGPPVLEAARPVRVDWPDNPPKPEWNWWEPEPGILVTQWRTSPVARDLNQDDLNDLLILDTEGYVAYFERFRKGEELSLRPGQRVFKNESGKPLRLNPGRAGKSGRRKWTLVDWDGDGKLDMLVDGKNIDFWRNIGDGAESRFRNEGPVAEKVLAGHDTCPTIVDWNKDAVPDLLVGAEDGFLYYLQNPRSAKLKSVHDGRR